MPGPAPDRFSRKSLSGGNGSWETLPAAGYTGPLPKWPLHTDPSEREIDTWGDLWRTPQAAMWAGKGLERTVARYVMASALVEIEPTASMMGELRQLEDRLGLSSMALKRLQWEVESIPQDKKLAEVTPIDRYANL